MVTFRGDTDMSVYEANKPHMWGSEHIDVRMGYCGIWKYILVGRKTWKLAKRQAD